MRDPVDLHEHLIQVPLPMTARAHRFRPSTPDLGCEHRTEPVPPEAHCFVADLDAPFVPKILDVAQRQREPDVEHHRQADDLRARLEVAERGALGHQRRLAGHPRRLKPSSSDNTGATNPRVELFEGRKGDLLRDVTGYCGGRRQAVGVGVREDRRRSAPEFANLGLMHDISERVLWETGGSFGIYSCGLISLLGHSCRG